MTLLSALHKQIFRRMLPRSNVVWIPNVLQKSFCVRMTWEQIFYYWWTVPFTLMWRSFSRSITHCHHHTAPIKSNIELFVSKICVCWPDDMLFMLCRSSNDRVANRQPFIFYECLGNTRTKMAQTMLFLIKYAYGAVFNKHYVLVGSID